MASVAITSNEGVQQPNRTAAWLLALCMFMTGGTGLVIQYVIATTATFILGSSIVYFSLVIGVMMGMMGAAGFIQERIGDKNLIEKFFIVELVLAIAGGFAPIGLQWAYGAMTEHFTLILYGWIGIIGAMIGLEIPIVMRIIEKENVVLKTNLKYVFAADYVGAAIFAIIWVYFLLPKFPITETSFLMSGLNFAVAMITLGYFYLRGSLGFPKLVLVTGFLALALNVYGYSNNRDWAINMEQRLYDDPIVHQQTTSYQHLVVTKARKACEDGSEEIRLYINGNTQFGSCDERIYHDNLIHPAMTLAGNNAQVLILGGGDGLALRDVLQYEPRAVTLVDLDPKMVEIARENEYLSRLNKGAFEHARVLTPETIGTTTDGGLFDTVYVGNGVIDQETGKEQVERVADVRRMHIDAGKFLESAEGTFDVVIIDLPDPSSVELSKLYTTAFYRQVRNRLAHGGLMVVQSTSPIHAREVFLEIGRTIESVDLEAIPYHDNVPSFGEWGWWLACKGDGCEARLRSRIARLQSFSVATTYLTPDRLRANLVFGNIGGVPYEQSASSSRINTMMDPTLFMRYETAWRSY